MSPKKYAKLTVIPAVGALALALAGCGDPGSSGTRDADDVEGPGCEPLAGETLVALEDDQNLQASENALAVFNADAASDEALEAVNAVAAELTTDDLVELNKAVVIDRETSKEAAEAFAEDRKLTDGLDGGSGEVTIGHADFAESETIAHLYRVVLSAAGFTAEVQAVGNREAYMVALQDGDFDVMPEYAATLTEFLNPEAGEGADEDPIASADIEATMETLRPFADEAGVTLGEPAEASSQNAYVVTDTFAAEHDVSTLSEFGEKCSGKATVLAGPSECEERIYCGKGLREVYGIDYGEFAMLGIGSDSQRAVADGTATLGTTTTTDGVLADDVTVDDIG
ncbi:MAG: glycine betaine ABC transporter substrate-binding protein [Stackebrandtia sp.]